MKTSFSVNVTGSITVSIEPSNEDGGGAAAAVDVVLVDVLLKSLIDAIKKYAGDEGTPTIEEEEDISSPLPQRRVPLDADAADDEEDEEDEEDNDDDDDDSTVDPDALNDEDEDQVSDLLPNFEIDNEYEEDNQLSQKMGLMSLRRRD
jgi:hypothetical protein